MSLCLFLQSADSSALVTLQSPREAAGPLCTLICGQWESAGHCMVCLVHGLHTFLLLQPMLSKRLNDSCMSWDCISATSRRTWHRQCTKICLMPLQQLVCVLKFHVLAPPWDNRVFLLCTTAPHQFYRVCSLGIVVLFAGLKLSFVFLAFT